MKAILLAATLLAASAGVSFAESDGDAFGQHLTGAPGHSVVAAPQPPAETPSMGIVQSSNSLPRGFNGPVGGPTASAPAAAPHGAGFAQLLPGTSGMGLVQTPNSLPHPGAARTPGHGG